MVTDGLLNTRLTDEEIEQIKNEIPTEPTEMEKYLDYISTFSRESCESVKEALS